jgi:hypothetical protein
MPTVYRRIVLDVAVDDQGQDHAAVELMPTIFAALGITSTPIIGGTGIQIVEATEYVLTLLTMKQSSNGNTP